MKIYSVGYRKFPSSHDLVMALQSHEVEILVDTRQSPYSRREEYSKKPLSQLCDAFEMQYVHLRNLGNKGRKEGTVDLVDEERGIEELERWIEKGTVAIMCVCSEVESCHRSRIEELLREGHDDFEVEYIEPPEKDDIQGELFV